MLDIEALFENRMPACYGIGLNERDDSLVLYVHEDLSYMITAEAGDLPYRRLSPLKPGDILTRVPQCDRGMLQAWELELRSFKKSGRRSGRLDWPNALAFSNSLAEVFDALHYRDKQIVECEESQLLAISMVALEKMSGCPIGGWVNSAFKAWLANQPEQRIPGVEAAMNEACERMFPGIKGACKGKIGISNAFELICSSGYLSGGVLSMHCMYREQLDSGNLNNPVDQLALLVGLAGLCDLYRKAHLTV